MTPALSEMQLDWQENLSRDKRDTLRIDRLLFALYFFIVAALAVGVTLWIRH